MKSQNAFILVMLVLFAVVPCFQVQAFGGTIRSGQYYTWGIDTDNVAIHPGSVITEAFITIHNLSSSSNNEGDALYIYLLDEPRLGFVADTNGGSNPFEKRGVKMVRVHHEQGQGGQDIAYTFSELAVEYSALWEHFGFPPLEFGPDDQMAIESSLILDLIDYAGGGTSFGFGFDPNGNTDYDFDKITLDLTIESYQDQILPNSITFTALGIPTLAHWAMDDNEPDTTVADRSGYGNHGTAQQNTEDINTAGIIDSALTFNGSSDYIDCGNNSSLQITDNLSISAWVRTLSGLRQFIVSKDDIVDRSYSLFIEAPQARFQIFRSNINYFVDSTTSINDGQWHHIVGINDGIDLKIYVDGTLEGTNSGAGGAIDNDSADVYIGVRSNQQYYFNGMMDGVRIFDHALSQAEVGVLYNNKGVIVNDSPLIATIVDKSIEENQTLSFTVSASDPDGDNMTYSASNLPAGASLDSLTGLFGWTPSDGDAEQYFVTFTVTDDGEGNLTDSATITITVTSSSVIPGLVAHWTLSDDEPDTTVTDISGYGNHGTVQQNTEDISTPGVIDGALTFNGTSDYVDCGNNSSLQITDNLSISAWVRTLSGLRQVIVSKDDIVDRSYSLFIEAPKARFQIFRSNINYFVDSTTSINDGAWHHIVGINDGIDLKIYVDGTLEATNSGAGGAIDNDSADLYIGVRSSQQYYFNGTIDEVKIFNSALSSQEITDLYYVGGANIPPVADAGSDQTVTDTDDNGSEQVTLDGSGSDDTDGTIVSWLWTDDLGDTIPDVEIPTATLSVGVHTITLEVTDNEGATDTDMLTVTVTVNGTLGLAGYWPMDDGANNMTVLDSSVNGNHGTAQQNTEDISTAGIIDDALTFNGTSDYIDCGNDSNLQMTGNLSISAWVRTSSGLRQFIVSKDDIVDRSHSLFIEAPQARFQIFKSDLNYYVDSTTSINDGQWHHIVGINDGTDLKIYVDGTLEATNSGAGGAIDNDSADVYIGVRSSHQYYFNGTIDEVRIYNRVLSESEVQFLWNY